MSDNINNLNIKQYVKYYITDKSKLPKFLQNIQIGDWDVTNVTDMRVLFKNYKLFNESLNKWNVSNVQNMEEMFNNCQNFNESLNDWNVSNVQNMTSMFNNCQNFNQPLNKWDVSKVKVMTGMFNNCQNFNQPLNEWDVSKVEVMTIMFNNCQNFNQSLNDWNVSKVVLMVKMFMGCKNFNQPLDNWNVSNVINMKDIFEGCLSLTSLPIWYKIPNKEIPIKLPETVFDVVDNENVNTNEYLNIKGNILFIFNNQFYLSSKKIIKNMINDPMVLFHSCKESTGTLNPSNINFDISYFNLRSLGLPIQYIKRGYMINILLNTTQKIYLIEETETNLPSVISFDVYYQQGNRVGATYCQEGKGGKVYNMFQVTEPNVGGKLSKTKKVRTTKKVRKNKKVRTTKKVRTRKNKKQKTRKTKNKKK